MTTTSIDDRRAPHVKAWGFSATAGELWNACPQAFAFKHELGIEEVASRPLRVGRLMAMTIERYLTHCFEHKVPTDITAIDEIARAVYAEEGVGLGLEALDEVLRICSYYVEQHTLDIEHLAGVEVWLPPHGAEDILIGGRRAYGKIDELYFDDEGRFAHVRDAKTNWSVWPERETRGKLQSRLYPILVVHCFPDVEEVRVTYDFVRWGVTREVVWTRGEIDQERLNLEAIVAQMQKPGKRPATPGEHCSICGYVSLCPVFKSARQNGVFLVPTNEAEAQRVVETTLVLESGLEQRRAALRAYTKEHGPIALNGVRVGYFSKEKQRVDAHAFAAWAEEHKADPLDYLELPARELTKLLKKRPKLRELVQTETETRFDSLRSDEPAEAVAS